MSPATRFLGRVMDRVIERMDYMADGASLGFYDPEHALIAVFTRHGDSYSLNIIENVEEITELEDQELVVS